MSKGLKLLLILFVCSLVAGTMVQPAMAQCAMCTTAVETNHQSGGSTADGLNHGIMYLLAAPYLAVAVVGYIWYKNTVVKTLRWKCATKDCI